MKRRARPLRSAARVREVSNGISEIAFALFLFERAAILAVADTPLPLGPFRAQRFVDDGFDIPRFGFDSARYPPTAERSKTDRFVDSLLAWLVSHFAFVIDNDERPVSFDDRARFRKIERREFKFVQNHVIP